VDSRSNVDGSETCWTLIRGAAAGDLDGRDAFARRYSPVVRAYLRARWAGSPLLQEVEDATQEAFVECFKAGGAIERVSAEKGGSFRGFLYGVVRNVARNQERRLRRRRDVPTGKTLPPEAFPADEESLGVVFDRAWATALVREAGALQRRRAAGIGADARRRVELLRLRFREGLPIREIAARWEEDPARVHREYAKARREFRDALLAVASFHRPGDPAEVERTCARLLDLFD